MALSFGRVDWYNPEVLEERIDSNSPYKDLT
jgi:hypothetical protein